MKSNKDVEISVGQRLYQKSSQYITKKSNSYTKRLVQIFNEEPELLCYVQFKRVESLKSRIAIRWNTLKSELKDTLMQI